jgi:site-specific DNA-cytosine methylase
MKPSAVFMENVKHILKHLQPRTFKLIQRMGILLENSLSSLVSSKVNMIPGFQILT